MNELRVPLRAGVHVAAARQLAVGLGVVLVGFLIAFVITDKVGMTAGICALALLCLPAMLGGGWLGRRFDRWLDERRPGVRFAGPVLTVPLRSGVRSFDFSAPIVVDRGWWSARRRKGMTGPRSATEGIWVYVAQNDVAVLFSSDDGTLTAEQEGLPIAAEPKLPADEVRIWARDALLLARATVPHRAG